MKSRNPSEVDRNPSLYPNVSFLVLQSAPGLVGLGASVGVGTLGWGQVVGMEGDGVGWHASGKTDPGGPETLQNHKNHKKICFFMEFHDFHSIFIFFLVFLLI